MIFSAEIRWFFEGRLAPAVSERFVDPVLSLGVEHRKEFIRDEPLRIDTYMLVPGADSVGMKVRQGMFEIKARRTSAGSREIAAQGAGIFESWCKMSMAACGMEVGNLWPEDRNCLRHVAKRRMMRKYVLVPGVMSCDADSLLDRGCNLELVEVELRDSDDPVNSRSVSAPYHSLAVEAFGEPECVEEIRDEMAAVLVERFDAAGLGMALTAANSFSYPAWLLSVGV